MTALSGTTGFCVEHGIWWQNNNLLTIKQKMASCQQYSSAEGDTTCWFASWLAATVLQAGHALADCPLLVPFPPNKKY